MTTSAPASALAPFRVRSFRFQWPGDIATSWAFEMESIILGWYILVATDSVLWLTAFASLRYLGTLLAPMVGVGGDRIGQRTVLATMRAFYTLQAATLMTLALTGAVSPVAVFVMASAMGLVQPSDIGMRAALIGDTMPREHLMSAMGIQRTSQDSAKIAGALTGAALVGWLGMGAAYAVVTTLYAVSMLLTLQAGRASRAQRAASTGQRPSPWRDLKEGLKYVRRTPVLLAVMLQAFLLNLTAFPLFTGLLPYVAKEIHHIGQTGLGTLVACGASGALLGSIALSRYGGLLPPARVMSIGGVLWFVMLLVFAWMPTAAGAHVALFFAGLCQSLSQVPMSAILLRACDEAYRGRVMGIRMMAIYGNLPGLLLAGPLIATVGYRPLATFYCVAGIAAIVLIAARWRNDLWSPAPGVL